MCFFEKIQREGKTIKTIGVITKSKTKRDTKKLIGIAIIVRIIVINISIYIQLIIGLLESLVMMYLRFSSGMSN